MTDVRVVDYGPQWRDDFARLNLEWLERWFSVEPIDEAMLGDPETHILGGGGHILMAVTDDDTAVGTVALKHHGDGVYELTKMAVEPGHRGSGIGRALMTAALDRYRSLDASSLFLESNAKLENALRLYERSGFQHRPAPPSPYARADIYMVWESV
ncbi:MAG: putative acetyltransferase [Actinomycetota bacterium]|jgi:GNAT superfamily N-acetyltransferase